MYTSHTYKYASTFNPINANKRLSQQVFLLVNGTSPNNRQTNFTPHNYLRRVLFREC
jgi:hypothetical protein